MPRGKKKAAEPVEVVEQEQEQEEVEVRPTLDPNNPPPRPMWRSLPEGPLTWVQCDLEGFEHIQVGFKTDNPWILMNGDVDNSDGYGSLRRVMLRARKFKHQDETGLWLDGWDFGDEVTNLPIPTPAPPDVASYLPVLLYPSLRPLGLWIIGEGYKQAQDIRAFGKDDDPKNPLS
jgi:hypothetical protein